MKEKRPRKYEFISLGIPVVIIIISFLIFIYFDKSHYWSGWSGSVMKLGATLFSFFVAIPVVLTANGVGIQKGVQGARLRKKLKESKILANTAIVLNILMATFTLFFTISLVYKPKIFF